MDGRAVPRVLLINPNTSVATTDMMVAIAREAAGTALDVIGGTAASGPAMIVEPVALASAAAEVLRAALAHEAEVDGVIVAAFGDPGLREVRQHCRVPSVGIAEAAMRRAATGGRRFGVATTTPALADAIAARVGDLGLSTLYTGIRLADGDPHALVADPDRLRDALARAVAASIERDGAKAVIIGGGPLGQAAIALQPMFAEPVIAPIAAAVGLIRQMLAAA